MLYRRQLQQQRQAARSPKEKDSKKDSDKEQVSENDEEQLKRLQAIAEKLSAERENASRLRQLKLAAQAVSIVKGLSADLKQAVAQLATAIILRFCWLNIISSFGLTLIYINTHFLAKYLGGNTLFCEFGEEWTLPEAGISGQEELKKKKGAAMFTAVKIAEFIVLFVVDVLAVLAIIFIVIGFVFAILQLPPLNLLLPAIATYQWMSSLVN